MEKMKRYPKLAMASLVLLVVALAMFWMNWVTLKQSPLINLLSSVIPALNNGGISFAEGRSLIVDLSELSNKVNSLIGQYAGSSGQSAHTLICFLNITYQVLFFGTFLAAAYCIYARLKWKGGLSEAIYFLFFIGDLAIIYLLMGQLNSLFGAGTFHFSIWGFVAFFCALLSEILWEEASFNTPNPLLNPKDANTSV